MHRRSASELWFRCSGVPLQNLRFVVVAVFRFRVLVSAHVFAEWSCDRDWLRDQVLRGAVPSPPRVLLTVLEEREGAVVGVSRGPHDVLSTGRVLGSTDHSLRGHHESHTPYWSPVLPAQLWSASAKESALDVTGQTPGTALRPGINR